MSTTAEGAAGRRLALVVATGSYADETLAKLQAPGRDAADLAAVLEDAAIGGFEVELALDAPAESLRRRVAQFCARVAPGDLALVYLSCHGVLDDRGRLYYATVDTDRALLSATAVSSAWLNEQLEDCRGRRQILVLDCCHSGAFAKGAKGESSLALRERFEGRGRVVLTGSRATEYSFEHGRVVGDSVSSVFTDALVDGLRSGDADRDGDGVVTVSELYDYAYETVRSREARQTPTLWTYGAEGDLLVAHSPRGAIVKPAPLPEDLVALLESPRPRVREGAVTELADLLTGADAGRALTARAQLERVSAEDVPSVAGAARAALDAAPVTPQPQPPPSAAPAAPPHPPRAGPPPPTDSPSPHRRRTVVIAAGAIAAAVIAGAVALLAGGAGRPAGGTGRPFALGRNSLSGSPRGVAVSAGVTWVARYSDNEVSWIEPSSPPKSVKVPPNPGKIVAGEGSVWVSVRDGTALVRIDPVKHKAGKEVPFDTEGCKCTITELAIAKHALWVGSKDGRTITKFELSSGKRLEELYEGSEFEGVFAIGGDAAWAIENHSHKSPEVIRIELGSGKSKAIPLEQGEMPSGIAYEPGKVWVADSGENVNSVTALNAQSNAVGKPIEISSVAKDDIAVAGETVFLLNTWDGSLTLIDANEPQLIEDGRPLRRYRKKNLVNLDWSDLVVDGGFAWVTEPAGNAVYKIKV